MKFLDNLFASLSSARERALREVDASTVREWHRGGGCKLIDVREPGEYQAKS
jgi:hypothetical protein